MNELLQSIDQINSTVEESEFEVMESMASVYMKHAMILENCDPETVDEIFIQEGLFSTNSETSEKKPGVLKKILNMIKSVLGFIGRLFKKLINFIIGLFRRQSKTADQIAEEVGLEPNEDSSKESKTKTQIKYEEFDNTGKGSKKTFDIELIKKDVIIKMGKNRSFHVKECGFGNLKGNDKNPNYDFPPGLSKNPIPVSGMNPQYKTAIACLTDDGIQLFNKFVDDTQKLFDALKRGESDIHLIIRTARQSRRMLTDHIDHKMYSDVDNEISYDAITALQKKVTELSKTIDDITGSEEIPENSNLGSNLKEIYMSLLNIQIGLNQLTHDLSFVQNVDKRFAGTAKTPEQVAKFAKLGINSGMTASNLIFNLYLISDASIRGNDIEIKAGQTRAVFFPDNNPDHVYKFALNGVGLASNRFEEKYTALTSKYPDLDNFIALITNVYEGGYGVEQERAEESEKSDRISGINDFLTAWEKWNRENPEVPISPTDVHYDNIGWSKRTNDWVALDYGMNDFAYKPNKK